MKNYVGVEKTFNYNKFVLPNWNRDIREAKLKRIDKSVKKLGWLEHPIMVNEKMEICDGQHRFMYAKEHNLPVYFIIVPGLSAQDCVTMNNARSSWTSHDYIKFFAEQGSQDYILLQGLVEKYTFMQPGGIANIVKGSVGSGNPKAQMAEGTFTMNYTEYQRAVKKLDFLANCSTAVQKIPGRPSALFSAIAFAYDCPGVDRARLKKQIQNYMNIITPPANNEMALKEIEYLYNYRAPKDSCVYILTEYKKQARARMARTRNGGADCD